jgi:drug/metabolite transporter (DMT)-like permease
MIPSFLTTFLFSCSILFASRSAREIGGMQANVARLVLAMFLLGFWAHGWGGGLGGASFIWFLFSGFVGFGLGDIAMFASLQRIGPRLTILLTQCLGAPIAGWAEYVFLGNMPSTAEMGCAGVILVGVAVAMAPDAHLPSDPLRFRWGLLWGLCSATGQGLGAVISRKANEVAHLHGQTVDGGTAAYQRILAGVAVTLVGWAIARVMHTRNGRQMAEAGTPSSEEGQPSTSVKRWGRSGPWIVGNAFSGPVLGVACFQWALMSSPSAVVLPIVSMSPLVTMGLAWIFQGTRPSARSVYGGILAVTGAAGLAWFKANAA